MNVLVPVPDKDFDITEVAVPWRLLTNARHPVTFATERGSGSAAGDPRLLDGVMFGRLGAAAEPKAFYQQMLATREFQKPLAWNQVEVSRFGGLLLPGGHAPGMRQYLESYELQRKVAEFWTLGRPVGAICHGVLILARTTDRATGQSVIAQRHTTCLLKYQERAAYLVTAWRLGRYYRTYPTYVEDEVKAVLNDPAQFERGPRVYTRRGTATDDSAAFALQDGNYLSARWPGDAYLFARRFIALLGEQGGSAR